MTAVVCAMPGTVPHAPQPRLAEAPWLEAALPRAFDRAVDAPARSS